MAPQELRLVFDEDADLYDHARPGYPDALFDDIVALAALDQESRVMEIGAGTGQATRPLAARGPAVVAVEPGASLAAVLRRNCTELPVTVVVADFEDVDLDGQRFEAVAAFTAWHWLTPGTRVTRAYEALRPGGSLITVTTEHVLGGTAEFFADVQRCYERWDPATPPGLQLLPEQEIPPGHDEVDTSELFRPAVRRRHHQDITYSTRGYLDLLHTYSGHRALAADQRTGLMGCIERLIDTKYQGAVTKRYVYELRVAQRAPG